MPTQARVLEAHLQPVMPFVEKTSGGGAELEEADHSRLLLKAAPVPGPLL
jgi:hypothetical protein